MRLRFLSPGQDEDSLHTVPEAVPDEAELWLQQNDPDYNTSRSWSQTGADQLSVVQIFEERLLEYGRNERQQNSDDNFRLHALARCESLIRYASPVMDGCTPLLDYVQGEDHRQAAETAHGLLRAGLASLRTAAHTLSAPLELGLESAVYFRTALETAARCLWLYGNEQVPTGHPGVSMTPEHIGRAAAAAKASDRNYEAFLANHDPVATARKRDTGDVLSQRDTPPPKFPSNTVLLRELPDIVGDARTPASALALWNFASALAHGDTWAELERWPDPQRGVHAPYLHLLVDEAVRTTRLAIDEHAIRLAFVPDGPVDSVPDGPVDSGAVLSVHSEE